MNIWFKIYSLEELIKTHYLLTIQTIFHYSNLNVSQIKNQASNIN